MLTFAHVSCNMHMSVRCIAGCHRMLAACVPAVGAGARGAGAAGRAARWTVVSQRHLFQPHDRQPLPGWSRGTAGKRTLHTGIAGCRDSSSTSSNINGAGGSSDGGGRGSTGVSDGEPGATRGKVPTRRGFNQTIFAFKHYVAMCVNLKVSRLVFLCVGVLISLSVTRVSRVRHCG